MRSKCCSECYCAIMMPHPELLFWMKCSICGFTEFDPKQLSTQDVEKAKKNKSATAKNALDERIWKPWLKDD